MATEVGAGATSMAKEVHCVAEGLYREARGESVRGEVAVGDVVLNRSRVGGGQTLCEVVHEHKPRSSNCTFSWACHLAAPITEFAAWHKAMAIADMLVSRVIPDVTGGATNFQICGGGLGGALPETTRIGEHCFYRARDARRAALPHISFAVIADTSAANGYRLLVLHGGRHTNDAHVPSEAMNEVAEAGQLR